MKLRASIEGLSKDIRYGLRQFIRNPLFTLIVVSSLGLGIGANVAIFNVMNAALFQAQQPWRGLAAGFEFLAALAGELAHVGGLPFTATTELPSGAANIVTARHQAGEEALTKAGVPSTFLRATGFDYNILLWLSLADGDCNLSRLATAR